MSSSFVFLQVEEALKQQLRPGVRQPHCWKEEVMIDLVVVEIPFWGL